MYSSTISILLSSIQTVQTLMIRERQSILSVCYMKNVGERDCTEMFIERLIDNIDVNNMAK
ncbi:hypothetical protein DERP_014046 [Dermatophagoides pteronyssinus]|uniref:Uncharacterized protein n=1 Tax=Dermatophagoides pteronyssinus TaxID=6956 RepID=A0ABQ8JCT5_DERPT|nr:hypothetical protein DERP_014046 [Dermatophagoides pteronyssinus]